MWKQEVFYEGRKYVLNNFTRINIDNSSVHRQIVAKLIEKQLTFAKIVKSCRVEQIYLLGLLNATQLWIESALIHCNDKQFP